MNPKPEPKLYFLAILPSHAIQQEVTAFKQTARERFGSGHALRSPPHVTLIPPFRSARTDFTWLQPFARTQPPFSVRLQNFGRFGNRVIFVRVEPNPALSACQARLAQFCLDQFGVQPGARPFQPHLTVAFRDLQRSVFADAWAYFAVQFYERQFTADAVTLLKHTGQGWAIEQEFSFGL